MRTQRTRDELAADEQCQYNFGNVKADGKLITDFAEQRN